MESVSAGTAGRHSEEGVTPSSLLLVPPDNADGEAPVSPGTMLLGLPLLHRSVVAARRAGFGQILILTPTPAEITPLLDSSRVTVLSPGDPIPPLPAGRLVLLAANVLPRPKWLRALLEMPIAPGQLYGDGKLVAVIDAVDARAILPVVSGGLGASDLFAALAQLVTPVYQPLGREGVMAVGTPRDVPNAEAWLLRGLIKENEGFMSRHVERRISLGITRRLVSTGMTPGAMTAVSVGIGLVGAPFFLSSSAAYQLAGGLLFLLHSILDGCDGELARLKLQESRWGGLFDFWGDNVVHVAVFLCMAVGWSLATQATWPLLLGALAVAGSVGSAGFAYWHTMRAKDADGPLFTSLVRSPGPGLSRLLDWLARRDFIYGVVLFSAFGKAAWFLALAGVGAPIFFLVLLWTARLPSHREERLP
ncbi:MAG: CDP-alcohol phosphatidyltransferase family protein [Candidatus Methylomirabilales bacterium]